MEKARFERRESLRYARLAAALYPGDPSSIMALARAASENGTGFPEEVEKLHPLEEVGSQFRELAGLLEFEGRRYVINTGPPGAGNGSVPRSGNDIHR